MIRLETKRLIIKDHIKDAFEHTDRLLSDEEAAFYMEELRAVSDTDSVEELKRRVAEKERQDRIKYFFTMEDKALHRHIGEIGYFVTDFLADGKMVRLGYFLFPEFWGMDYTTEAVLEVMRYAFEENGVCRLSVSCKADSGGSLRVMNRCGMTRQRDYEAVMNRQLVRRTEFAITKTEWKILKDQLPLIVY